MITMTDQDRHENIQYGVTRANNTMENNMILKTEVDVIGSYQHITLSNQSSLVTPLVLDTALARKNLHPRQSPKIPIHPSNTLPPRSSIVTNVHLSSFSRKRRAAQQIVGSPIKQSTSPRTESCARASPLSSPLASLTIHSPRFSPIPSGPKSLCHAETSGFQPSPTIRHRNNSPQSFGTPSAPLSLSASPSTRQVPLKVLTAGSLLVENRNTTRFTSLEYETSKDAKKCDVAVAHSTGKSDTPKRKSFYTLTPRTSLKKESSPRVENIRGRALPNLTLPRTVSRSNDTPTVSNDDSELPKVPFLQMSHNMLDDGDIMGKEMDCLLDGFSKHEHHHEKKLNREVTFAASTAKTAPSYLSANFESSNSLAYSIDGSSMGSLPTLSRGDSIDSLMYFKEGRRDSLSLLKKEIASPDAKLTPERKRASCRNPLFSNGKKSGNAPEFGYAFETPSKKEPNPHHVLGGLIEGDNFFLAPPCLTIHEDKKENTIRKKKKADESGLLVPTSLGNLKSPPNDASDIIADRPRHSSRDLVTPPIPQERPNGAPSFSIPKYPFPDFR